MKDEYSDGFFSVDQTHGFLPIRDPLVKLPDRYSELQNVLDQMTINGDQGYLAHEGMIKEKAEQLKLYQFEDENDIMVIQALYRGYCFLASAYLLEPSYHHYLKNGEYGPGRRVLPANMAVPLVYLADRLETKPWMEYSYGYSLGNYVKKDLNGGLDWDNLGMAVSFSGTNDESGFIMVHVDLNQHSPDLVGSVMKIVNGENVGENLGVCLRTIKKINQRRREMWRASDHRRYNDFRVFIMGIKGNNKVFGDGVVYEGTRYGEEPQQFRGQSGSQDTIIPMMDICFGVNQYYPKNELTEYLMDMRSYRPKPFRDFLSDLEVESEGLIDRVAEKAGVDGLVKLLGITDEIYRFRNGHWQFVQKYIMANTKYPVATGGTPIVSWIPNQIEATLMCMRGVMERIESLGGSEDEMYLEIKDQYEKKMELLRRQINELKSVDYDVDLIYDVNREMGENDVDLKN